MAMMKFGDYAQKLFEGVDDEGEEALAKEISADQLAANAAATSENDGTDIDDFGKSGIAATDADLMEDDGDELTGTLVGGDEDINPEAMNADSKKELEEAKKWWKGKSLKEQEKVAFRLFKAKKAGKKMVKKKTMAKK